MPTISLLLLISTFFDRCQCNTRSFLGLSAVMGRTLLMNGMLPYLVVSGTKSSSTSVTSAVIRLTDDDFEKALNVDELWIIKFYAPWCNYCIKMAPLWDELSTIQTDAKIAKVDCTKQKKIANQFDIKSFPTLKYVKNGVVYDYLGSRTKEAFLGFIDKMKRHHYVELNTIEEIEKLYPRDTMLTASGEVIANYPKEGEYELNNGAVFLLTINQVITPKITEDITSTDEVLYTKQQLHIVENSFSEVAKKLHSMANFAILRIGLSGTETVDENIITNNQQYRIEISKMERKRTPKKMSLNALEFDSDTKDITSIQGNTVVPSLIPHYIEQFVLAHNYPLISVFEGNNFKRLADLRKLMVIAIVQNTTAVTHRKMITDTSSPTPQKLNKYKSYDADGIIQSLDNVASDVLSDAESDQFIFGFLDANKWKKFLKQYKAKAPGLLLLGQDYKGK